MSPLSLADSSLVVKVPGDPNERWANDVGVTCGGNKDVNLRHDGVKLHPFKAHPQSAEGVTFSKQLTSTRTTKS